MFHMLPCFDLNPGEEIGTFQSAYAAFVDELKRIDLVESTGPIGDRQRNTLMDTDDERDAAARQRIEGYFPERDVFIVEMLESWNEGGGVHCHTNDQPAIRKM